MKRNCLKSLKNKLSIISFSCALGLSSFSVPAFEEAKLAEAEKENLKVPVKLQDLAYGNILFEYYRGNTIEALNAILVAEKRQALPNHVQSARLLSGVIYLDLGMLDHAQKIFNDLLTEEDLKSGLLARLEFFLGKLHYQQGDYAQAEFRLSRIVESIDVQLQHEAFLMLSNIAVATGDLNKAKAWLDRVTTDSKLSAYSRYNLGVLWLRQGNLQEAKLYLNKIHPSYTEDDVIRSLIDKAHTALGYYALSNKEFEAAREEFQQVRLKSPSANKALLGMGWSYLETHSPKRALAHWLELQNRDIRDLAVQEALLAIPYAYQKLQSMQLALDSYETASETFDQQIKMIDNLKARIENEGLIEKFLDKLILSKGNTIDDSGVQDSNLFGDEYDYYLYELISQHRFNENFRSYQKLGKLAQILSRWEEQLPIFDEIVKANVNRFETRLPKVEAYIAEGAFDAFESQLVEMEQNIVDLRANKNMHLLANEEEMDLYNRVARVNETIARLPEGTVDEDQVEQARRAKMVLQWQLETDKAGKIWQLEKSAIEVRKTLEEIKLRKAKLQRVRVFAEQRFTGFQQKVDAGKASLLGLREKILAQIEVQSFDLKSQIIKVLDSRRATLDHYLLQSDLSVARMHEKAVVIPEAE